MTARFHLAPGRHRRQAGFSLVELLTVVGIIALLVSILLPSLRSARLSAKRTATAAIIKSMSDGLEMFHNDFNRYPDSRLRLDPLDLSGDPYNLPAAQLSGAHWLLRGLMGFDGQGVDGKALMMGDGANGTIPMPDPANTSDPSPLPARKNAYIEEMKFAADTDTSVFQGSGSPNTGRPVAYDVFRGPILYYRANPRAQQPFDNSNNRLGIYNLQDNAMITTNWDFAGEGGTALPVHPLGQYGNPANPDEPPAVGSEPIPDAETFIGYLHNHEQEKIAGVVQPVRKNGYVIISAGPDGLLGTQDDVKNFD